MFVLWLKAMMKYNDENSNKKKNGIPLRFTIIILAIQMCCNPNMNSIF